MANEQKSPLEVPEAIGGSMTRTGLGLPPNTLPLLQQCVGMNEAVTAIEGQFSGNGVIQQKLTAKSHIIQKVARPPVPFAFPHCIAEKCQSVP